MDPLHDWRIAEEPRYQPQGDEVALFEAAWDARLPVMLKGPTGCGKSRFVEHMAWRLGRPLVTVACNEDMSAADLVGRFLLEPGGTRWQDGPLTRAARHGAICYLDEVVEARQDTVVVMHALTDHRRQLPLDKTGELLRAHPDFQLVISYNPGYQSLVKDLKPSTRQRFCAFDFDYPAPEREAAVLVAETGLDTAVAGQLIEVAQAARRLKGHGLAEGISTRLLVHAGQLIRRGVAPATAARLAMVRPVTDDADLRDALEHAVDALLA